MQPVVTVARRFLRWLPTVLGALAVTAVMICLYIAQPSIIRQLDAKVYDALLPLARRESISPALVIIDIDEPSLAEYGQWPWSRHLLAKLLVTLHEAGVASVGLDILLSEPDRSSPARLLRDIRRDAGLDVEFRGLPEELTDYDALLSEALKKLPVILGGYVRFGDGSASAGSSPAGVPYLLHERPEAMDFKTRILTAVDATFPLPILAESAPVGLINMSPDADGIVRKLPLVIMLDDKLYLSLSLRSLMVALGKKNVLLNANPDGLYSLRIGPYTVPVDPEGNALVPFQGSRKTYPYISAKDVLTGALPPGALEGRIVFLGTSAPGLLDIRSTPFDRVYPGVEVHAAFLDAVLSGQFLQVPPWTPGLQILGIILAGLTSALAFGFARPQVYIPLGILLLGSCLYASRHLFTQGVFISPLYVVLTVTAQGSILLFLRFWQEERQKLVLRNAFSRYVSPEVVKRITRLSGDIFAGEERELSIMFTDIRRFTSLSENLSPQQIVLLLNRYFTPMTALVRANSGTLDKFIGDALMAFWNAPVAVPDHALRAVETALAMHEKLELLNVALAGDFGIRIDMGVGVHTGKAYVGNMGSEDLLNYTLIGDAVNLTSRLEGLCPLFGVGVIVSGETREACGDAFAFQNLDTVTVKGKRLPVDVYTVMRHAAWQEREEEMLRWDETRQLYRQGNFIRAGEILSGLQRDFPSSTLFALYAERCKQLAADPPAAWGGIWTLHAK